MPPEELFFTGAVRGKCSAGSPGRGETADRAVDIVKGLKYRIMVVLHGSSVLTELAFAL